jgi:hypothetical protein
MGANDLAQNKIADSSKVADHREGEAPAEPFGSYVIRGSLARQEPRPPDAVTVLHNFVAEPEFFNTLVVGGQRSDPNREIVS